MNEGELPCSLGQCRVLRDTDKAMLVELEDDPGNELWIPKSIVHDDSEVYAESPTGELVVMTWWAEKEGLDG